jgi:hypothetical protein
MLLTAQGGFSKSTLKIKIAEHRSQGPRSECPCLSPWSPESLQDIFADLADDYDESISETSHEFRK